MTNDTIDYLVNKYSELTFKRDETLSKYTTVKLGGPAKLFVCINKLLDEPTYFEMKESKEKQEVLKILEKSQVIRFLKEIKDLNIRYHILGGGSDTLFSDDVYDGIVIKLGFSNHFPLKIQTEEQNIININARHNHFKQESRNDLDFKTAYFKESQESPTLYYAESGCMLSALILLTLNQNLSGLQWFSHIPASIGGAIYNNIHGGEIMFSEYVEDVFILNDRNELESVSSKEMDFGYDDSRIQYTNEIILGSILRLYKQSDENINLSKAFVENWVKQKIDIQPKEYSVGSTFKNITEEDRIKHNLPTNSAGYLIDQCGLKGFSIGGAEIYERHGNFFLNKGNATSDEYKKLIDYTISKVKEKFGITLEPEVKIINFKNE